MIPEENVLAPAGIVILPVDLCILDCGKRRMFLVFKINGKTFKEVV
jgi:hypothetical protein